MTEYIRCASCGTRMKADRDRCLRCDEPLIAAPPSVEPTRRERALVVATLASVALLIALTVVWERATRPVTDTVARPLVARRAASPASSADAAGASAAEALIPITSIESQRLGAVSYGSGDFEAARRQFEDALQKDPNNVDALNNLGTILARERRTVDAIELFTRAAAVAPNKWAAHFNLAHAFGEQGKWDAAIGEYRIAARLLPDDYAVEYNLAMALHKMGNEDAAVAGYRKAIQLAPGEPTFHLSLAISLERLGRTADARDEYRQYVDMRPDAPDAARVRARADALSRTLAPAPPAP